MRHLLPRFSLLRLGALFALLASAAPASLLYIADSDGGTVSTLSPGGLPVELVTGLAYPRAIAVYGGRLLVADNDEIKQFDASTGASLGVFATLTGVDSLVVDLLGNVFAASSTDGSLVKYNSSGATVASVTGLDTPGSLALDDQGRLFVTQNDGLNGMQGFRYLAADLSTIGAFITSGLNTPMAATYHGGTLYISDLFGGIDQVDSSGNVTTFASTNLSFPWGLAFNSDGDLFVANSSDGFIHRFDSSGTFVDSPASGFITPSGLAFAEVPEPATYLLFGGALLALGTRRRRPSDI